MSSPCCSCSGGGLGGKPADTALPLICLVPKGAGPAGPGGTRGGAGGSRPSPAATATDNFQLLDEDYIKKHFDLPQRALYLDPFHRPLITFPMNQGVSNNFSMYRKTKINQQILDGAIEPSEAIVAPSIFPYAKNEAEKKKVSEDNEEIIYILQLPDWEFKCPVHNQIIRTPRFIWHSCKKATKEKGGEMKRGGGPMNKPKPWLLSRHTDFDLLSQW